MEIAQSLNALSISSPIALTIGNFDGVHLGHLKLLTCIAKSGRSKGLKKTVITFSNHPSSVLKAKKQPLRICTPEHKIHLIKEAGIDLLLDLPFTEETATLSAEAFLTQMHKQCPIQHLVLGRGATLGYNQSGSEQVIKNIGNRLNFPVEYVEPLKINAHIVSSSFIRSYIKEGRLVEAEEMLGRRYSILKETVGSFPIDVSGLCVPPDGVYAVKVFDGKEILFALAELANQDDRSLLNIKPLDPHLQIREKVVEIIFYAFLRPSMCFSIHSDETQTFEKDARQARTLLLTDLI